MKKKQLKDEYIFINSPKYFCKPKMKRLPIPIDEAVIIELKHLIETRTQKRMSMAAIVRFALEELLKVEAELSE